MAKSSDQNLLVKTGSLSLTMEPGTLYSRIMLSKNTRATDVAV
jgi:hypothetical protein